MKSYIYLTFSLVFLSSLSAQEWQSFHEVETLQTPDQRWVPGVMAVHPDKRVAFTTNRGEVWIADYQKGFSNLKWQRYAMGLRSPSKLKSENGRVFVLQNKTTWTLLKDEDNNGVADAYIDQHPAALEAKVFSPYKGMNWLQPKQDEPFKGQCFGYSAGDQFVSRMAIVSDSTGLHYSKLTLQDGFRFPIGGMLALPDHSWIVSQTNRTDLTRTRLRSVLQRLVWKTPLASFEIDEITASADCFTIGFTEPLNPETAQATWSYTIQTMPDQQQAKIKKLVVNPSNPKEVAVYLDAPIESEKFYQISCDAIWSLNRNPVRNPTALFIWKLKLTDR